MQKLLQNTKRIKFILLSRKLNVQTIYLCVYLYASNKKFKLGYVFQPLYLPIKQLLKLLLFFEVQTQIVEFHFMRTTSRSPFCEGPLRVGHFE